MLTKMELNKKILEFEQRLSDVKKEEEFIIKFGNASDIYNLARDINGVDIEKLEDAIISAKDVRYIYYFAQNIEGANIQKLENAIIATKDAEYIYYFARDVNGANIERLEDTLVATKNAEYIYKFAKDVNGANIKKLESAVIKLGHKSYIYQFAINIKGSNLYKLLLAYGTAKSDDNQNVFLSIQQTFKERKAIENMIYLCDEWFNKINKDVSFETRKILLKYLLKHRNEGNNEIILRIYFDYLNSPTSTYGEKEICNQEYIKYMASFIDEENENEEEKSNVKVKKI